MTDFPVAGPLGELHLGHESRLDPVRALRERAGRRGIERRDADLEGLEELAQPTAERVVPTAAGADFPGEPQRFPFVIPDEDGADTLARAFGLSEPADDEFLAPNALCLLPVVGPPPGPVRRCAALADDPFRAEAARVREHRGAVRLKVWSVANDTSALSEKIL